MIGDSILVSIITVCFNSEQTIRRTIESVLHQTYKNIEYIIIDGCSTDSTCRIILEYKGIFGERLKFLSESDNGIYDAMNKGIQLSSGELIGIINSDDFYELNAVEKMVSSWDRAGMQILHGLMRQLWHGKEYGVTLTSANFIYEKMIQHPTCFVTKDVYEQIGLYDTQYKYVADKEFMIRAYEKGITFKPVYCIIANYETAGGASTKVAALIEKEKLSRKKRKISIFIFWIMCLYSLIKSKVYKKIWKSYI